MQTDRLRQMIAKALETATPTLRDVADWCGVSYHTVRSWRLCARTAPPTMRLQLARVLRRRAERLEEFADRLERSAESEL